MVAIADFDADAMENCGLVTYRTNSILFDEATTTQASKWFKLRLFTKFSPH